MAKGTKKKPNRKLRRQIRKTIGALLMISAITVAAIPVQDVSANPTEKENVKVAVVNDKTFGAGKANPMPKSESRYKSTVPYVSDLGGSNPIIYTSGNGTFQFAYISPTANDPNKVAVILGYNAGVLMESSLTIPDKLEAYMKYTDNTTREGYCLVSKKNEFLHYVTKVQETDADGRGKYRVINLFESGGSQKIVNESELYIREDGSKAYRVQNGFETDPENPSIITTVPHYDYYEVEAVMIDQYNPCYYEQEAQWRETADKTPQNLYYWDSGQSKYIAAGNESDHWKIDANVAFIGGEKITDDGRGGWRLDGPITDPNDGVFANQNNITNLTIGSNILGISDYAFYGCATLQNVSLANGLQTIGNGAFADCIRLESCNIASNANIQAIGKDAFYNCQSLKSFTCPIGLRALGDSCFENCFNLQTVDLCGGGGAVSLAELGDHLFKGCKSLTSLEFPSTYTENNLNIDMFEGCSSLQYVRIPNDSINFISTNQDPSASVPDQSRISWETFKTTVPASFYFEGPGVSKIHDTATAQSIAFKYLGQDLYEKIEYEHDKIKDSTNPSGKSAKVTYQVNSSNELVKFWINSGDKPDNVTIPETIGPYGIASIGQGSFTNNCDLIKITIPASVTSIGDNAFKGCHNLETVIFTDASTMQSIGTDAFKTQVITCGETLSADPKLTFVGAMMNAAGEDTVPFIYAMNGVSNINNPNQNKIWITCHSGWPTNLEVQYQFDPLTQTGEAQLVGYPRYEMINNPSNAAIWVSKLPYVTTENQAEYTNMVTKATKYYEYTKNPSGTPPEQPTENEMAIVTSTLNVAIPSSVDSIKPGLFSGWTYDEQGNEKDVPDIDPDTNIQTILLNGVDEIEPYTFKECTSLKSADLIGSEFIGNYAFDGCTSLEVATLGADLEDTGLRPFKGCKVLTTINSLDADYLCKDGVLYHNTGNGTEIVECLESRGDKIGSYSVGPDELAGVTSIMEEAFKDCDKVGKVDLSSTTVDVIPERCFEDTDDLNSVVLPDTVKNIEADSFKSSKIRLLTIPGMQAYIAQDAFKSNPQQTIIFECVEGTTADRYAKQYDYINPEYGKVNLEHTVYFWDYPNYPDTTTKSLFHKVKVIDGQDAVPPTSTPSHEGHPFSRWTDYTNIVRDTDVYPVFGENSYVVTFMDTIAGKELKVETVEQGKSATPPEAPVHDGYTFKGWSPDYHSITADTIVLSQYENNSTDSSRFTVTFYSYDGKTVVSQQKINKGEAATAPMPPDRAGYTFTAWVPDTYKNVTSDMNIIASYTPVSPTAAPGATATPGKGSATASPSPSATPTTTPEVKKYTVSVSGGSGSGSYPAGAVVAVNAYFRGEGQSFDKWTSSTAGVGFADPNASSTTFTMPAANVAITATYKTGSTSSGGSGTGSGTASSGSTGGSSSSGTSQSSNNGTTVQVTKPGISNTNLAGATVSGATDNFVIKVSEDQSAASAVVAALQAKYGDISRIKYLPMDISLYDSTGRTKIADTSGISINITLPLPDDLVQYAGNNKVAAVSNGILEDINTRFTTVDGVPCVNFTASHFSPYVIYVDTANLTEGTIDVTPKTGDPIHPKWFLALGMACVSMILFFKRDKAVVKTKTA
ncbi:MAG: leucine-rich repeat protein [Lachnospiraceae bacterium]|nr:leucine-rich repeat protein [Lachnospiraceae bacterium]